MIHKIHIKTIIGIISILLLFNSCEIGTNSGGGHGGHDDHEDHGDHEDHNDNSVKLTQQQMDAIDLTTVEITKKSIGKDITVNGNIELPPQHKADISPVMGGIVKSIRVIEGDKVKKGQTLATLQHPDFIQLQEDYANNLNNFEYIEADYLRQKKLNEEKVTSDKNFQKVSNDYKNLKSTLNAQKIKLQMLGISTKGVAEGTIYATINITSPFNGYVSKIETNIGSYVEPMSKLFEVVNNDELHADFMVFEKDINNISVGQKVFFTTSSLTQEFKAEIHNISPVFEEEPKALHVHAEIISDKTNLIPGMYIGGHIVSENVDAQVVPQAAIVQDKGKYYIFVKESKNSEDHGHSHDSYEDEQKGHDYAKEKEDSHEGHGHGSHDTDKNKQTFTKVEVIVGVSNGTYTEIKLLSPLNHHAKIVSVGAYFLLAEMGKSENEHVH